MFQTVCHVQKGHTQRMQDSRSVTFVVEDRTLTSAAQRIAQRVHWIFTVMHREEQRLTVLVSQTPSEK